MEREECWHEVNEECSTTTSPPLTSARRRSNSIDSTLEETIWSSTEDSFADEWSRPNSTGTSTKHQGECVEHGKRRAYRLVHLLAIERFSLLGKDQSPFRSRPSLTYVKRCCNLMYKKSKVEIAWTKTLTRWSFRMHRSLSSECNVSFNCFRSPWLEWTKCQLFSFLLLLPLFVLSRMKWMNECEQRRGNRPTSCRTNNTHGQCSFRLLSFSLWNLQWTGGHCFCPFYLFRMSIWEITQRYLLIYSNTAHRWVELDTRTSHFFLEWRLNTWMKRIRNISSDSWILRENLADRRHICWWISLYPYEEPVCYVLNAALQTENRNALTPPFR